MDPWSSASIVGRGMAHGVPEGQERNKRGMVTGHQKYNSTILREAVKLCCAAGRQEHPHNFRMLRCLVGPCLDYEEVIVVELDA